MHLNFSMLHEWFDCFKCPRELTHREFLLGNSLSDFLEMIPWVIFILPAGLVVALLDAVRFGRQKHSWRIRR